MYITRRLSEYRRNPSELTQPPPEGPSSGVLVIHDQHSQIQSTCCFGSCEVVECNHSGLPLTQNLKLAVLFNSGGDDSTNDPIVFIPVLDKPLSSNCYYAIRRRGKYSGYDFYSSKSEKVESWIFFLKS